MVLVIRYEGPKGGPGMKEMLNPTSAVMVRQCLSLSCAPSFTAITVVLLLLHGVVLGSIRAPGSERTSHC